MVVPSKSGYFTSKKIDAEVYYLRRIDYLGAKVRAIKKNQIAKNSGMAFVTFVSNK